MSDHTPVSDLLRAWSAGDATARNEVIPWHTPSSERRRCATCGDDQTPEAVNVSLPATAPLKP